MANPNACAHGVSYDAGGCRDCALDADAGIDWAGAEARAEASYFERYDDEAQADLALHEALWPNGYGVEVPAEAPVAGEWPTEAELWARLNEDAAAREAAHVALGEIEGLGGGWVQRKCEALTADIYGSYGCQLPYGHASIEHGRGAGSYAAYAAGNDRDPRD